MRKGYHSLEEFGRAMFAAKAARRKRLARLPIAKKVEILVRMQRLAAPLLKAQGREARVWNLNPDNLK